MHAIPKSALGLPLLVAALIICCAAQRAIAQDAPSPSVPVIENPSSGSNLVPPREVKRDPLTSFFEKSLNLYEFWLVIIIVVMSLATIICVTVVVAMNKAHQPRDIWLPAIVFSIIGAILISVTAGFKNEQIGPAFGLFGTMIGYLLRSLSGNSESVETPEPPPATSAVRKATAASPGPAAASAGSPHE